METTAVDWGAIVRAVNEAAEQLKRSPEVPPAVEVLVTELPELLHAESPQTLAANPYLTTSLFAGMARAEKAIRHDDADTRRRELRIALEQVRHALRDIATNRPVDDTAPMQQVLAATAEATAASQADIASLYGTSTRTLQRWIKGDAAPAGADAARVRIVAQLVNQLRYVFTGPGVLVWFTHKSPALGKAPVDCLDDPRRYPELIAAATATRAMTG